jgi:hypothetical protein
VQKNLGSGDIRIDSRAERTVPRKLGQEADLRLVEAACGEPSR